MIRLDTMKLGTSIDSLKDFDLSAYNKTAQLDDDDNIKSKIFRLKSEREIEGGLNKKLGITSIDIKPNKVVMEISSKVLRKNYAELINKNNIVEAIENINATGLINLDTNEVLDSAELYKFDVTSNLPVKKKSEVYLRDISILGTKRKYKIDAYKSGFVLTNKAKTIDERLIAYDKKQDLLKKDKWNREILKHIDINDYDNVFRIEGNYRTYDTMRKYFHFKRHKLDILRNKDKATISLSDVLLSDANPNLELFNSMLSNKSDATANLLIELLDSDLKLYKIEKEIGRAEIIKHCDYNMINIKRLLQSKLEAKNISKYLREYEATLNKLKQSELADYSNINEVLELLKVA